MKKFVYMVLLIVLAAACSLVFSFVHADKFLFYIFFFFIGAFLCGTVPLTALFLFLAADYIITGSEIIYLVQLFVFVLLTGLFSKKLGVYPSAVSGYVLSCIFCMVLRLFAGQDVFIVFDKLILYIINFIVAPPFVFAMMRAGIIRRRKG